jgi:regulatory protein
MQEEKVRNLAWRYLTYREVSSYELFSYLKRKGVSSSQSQKIISELKEKGYINDRKYALSFISERKKRYGVLRIKRDLQRKGFPREEIEEYLKGVNSLEEKEVALTLAKRKMEKVKSLPASKAKQRIFNFLRGRGFPFSLCQEVIAELHSQFDTIFEKE